MASDPNQDTVLSYWSNIGVIAPYRKLLGTQGNGSPEHKIPFRMNVPVRYTHQFQENSVRLQGTPFD